jgi:hypothetical protein
MENENLNRKFRWLFALGALMFLGFILFLLILEEVTQVDFIERVYISKDVEVTEMFLCEGLDHNGIPINPMETVNSTQWEKIHLCAYVTTSEPSTLFASWLYQSDFPFAGRGFGVDISVDGYIDFSLKEAVAESQSLEFPNYLAEEIEEGYIPTGKYNVDIYQSRIKIGSFSFIVEN